MNIGPNAYFDLLAWLSIAILVVVTTLAMVSPTLALHKEAALLQVSTPPGTAGPTLFMGLLGEMIFPLPHFLS